MITVTKRVEFDAGHRIPDHASKCANLHGHHYVVEVEVAGPVLDKPGDPANGMVLDFGALRSWLTKNVHDRWDHGFLVARNDVTTLEFLQEQEYKHDVMLVPPTAENIAADVAARLDKYLRRYQPETLVVRVTVWETPTCNATWRRARYD